MIEVRFGRAQLARLRALDLTEAVADEGLRLELAAQLERAHRRPPDHKQITLRVTSRAAAALDALLGRVPPDAGKRATPGELPKAAAKASFGEQSLTWLSFSGVQAERIHDALLVAGDLPEGQLKQGPYNADTELVARARTQWLRRNRYPAQTVAWRARRQDLDPDVILLLERLALTRAG